MQMLVFDVQIGKWTQKEFCQVAFGHTCIYTCTNLAMTYTTKKRDFWHTFCTCSALAALGSLQPGPRVFESTYQPGTQRITCLYHCAHSVTMALNSNRRLRFCTK